MVDPLTPLELLAAAQVAVLGTVAPDGRPRLVPVTYAIVGESVVIAIDHKPKTTTRLARLADIERDPKVTLLAHHYEADWSQLWWVRADGTAIVRDRPPPEVITALTAKYSQYRAQPPIGEIIDITVERWSQWPAASVD